MNLEDWEFMNYWLKIRRFISRMGMLFHWYPLPKYRRGGLLFEVQFRLVPGIIGVIVGIIYK